MSAPRPTPRRVARPQRRAAPAAAPDLPARLALYECCVQDAPALASLLTAIHGGRPRTLAEDFCGSAALSRHWATCSPRHRAVGIDLDAPTLAFARAALDPRAARRVRFIRQDLLAPPATPRPRAARPASTPAPRARPAPTPDIIFVGNFSIGEIHHRAALVAYLRHARLRLARGGVFVCDTYGGATAFVRGAMKRVVPAPPGPGARSADPRRRVRYTWQQREADPLTGLVENAIHFRVERDGQIEAEFTDAFVYRWRLWSVPELRDALAEAGFRRSEVYAQLPDAVDSAGAAHAMPVTDPRTLDETFIVCVAAGA